MKDNWEYKKLEETCEFLDSKRKPITANKRTPGPYPYYGATGILDYVENYLFDEELILLGEDGAKWDAGDNSAFLISGKTWVNNHAHVLRPNYNVFSNWIIYFLNYSNLMKYVKGATVPKLNQENARSIEIPLPSLEEQKRIVKILDEKFAMLETVKANAKTNLQNAKDLFQSQLTKAFSNTTWEKKRLDSIANIKSGFAFKGSAFKTEGEYQVLRLGNVKQNYLRVEEKAVFVSGISESDLLKAKVNIGDLVVTQTGTKGKRDYGFVAIIDRENLYNRYLLYYSYTENFKDQFFANEGGTVGQGNIGLNDIKGIEIPLPPLSEQKRIVEQLDSLSEKVRSLEEIYTKQLANCDELKQAFLAKAFNGEL